MRALTIRLGLQRVRGSNGLGRGNIFRFEFVFVFGEIKFMCGIVGYLDKNGADQADVGQILRKMLGALENRGPDRFGRHRDLRSSP